MILPKAIKCGPYVYRLEHVVRLCSEDHERLIGQHDARDFVIRIDDGIPDQRARVVILHELLHAIEAERSLDLTENSVNQLAHALADLFIENPDLARIFIDDKAAG